MKSQEKRINDATRRLHEWADCANVALDAHKLAVSVLEAADRETSTWPTTASVRAASEVLMSYGWAADEGQDEIGSELAEALHTAMRADPIIQAAITYRDAMRDTYGLGMTDAPEELIAAVNEAGL